MPASGRSCANGLHLRTHALDMSLPIRTTLFSIALMLINAAAAQSLAPDITVTKVINAPVAEVWKAWTTAEGIESFFAPKAAQVVPEPGGVFELWFGLDLPAGSRGSEGYLFHSVVPMRQLVFEWNAPPTIPTIRRLRTLVYLDFVPVEGDRTSLTLRNFGYGQGEEWAKAKAYFERAWPAVMASLEKRFANPR